jgi:hypothetical protein
LQQLYATLSDYPCSDFYELIRQEINEHSWTRDKVKEKFFETFLFSKGENDSAIRSAFNHIFPQVSRVIKHLRREGNSAFSVALQKEESRAFFQVWKALYEKIPAVTLISRHDSILVDQDNAVEVRHIMFEVLSKHTHLRAKVKVKNHQVKYEQLQAQLDEYNKAKTGYSTGKHLEYQDTAQMQTTEAMVREKYEGRPVHEKTIVSTRDTISILQGMQSLAAVKPFPQTVEDEREPGFDMDDIDFSDLEQLTEPALSEPEATEPEQDVQHEPGTDIDDTNLSILDEQEQEDEIEEYIDMITVSKKDIKQLIARVENYDLSGGLDPEENYLYCQLEGFYYDDRTTEIDVAEEVLYALSSQVEMLYEQYKFESNFER